MNIGLSPQVRLSVFLEPTKGGKTLGYERRVSRANDRLEEEGKTSRAKTTLRAA